MDDDSRDLSRHDADDGRALDLSTLVDRRRALRLIAGVGLASVAVACGSDEQAGSPSTSARSGSVTTAGSSASTAPGSSSCSSMPEETAGPFPGDGSNGPNVLSEPGIVRSDIRSSFGSSTTVAEGVPLTIELTVRHSGDGCRPRTGAAVYIWHCDREGRYSLYSDGATDENYLRGLQEADTNGVVRFKSIFPGAYSGRWPHVHFEVYASLREATRAGTKLSTSQLAFPEDVCDVVYATAGYTQSDKNFARTSIDRDMVFQDGYTQQLATMTGGVDEGFVAKLSVAV